MANFGRQLRFQTTLRKIFCFGIINAPQQVFYPRYRTSVHRQMAIPKPNEDCHAHGIARHFTAQTEIDTMYFRFPGDHRQSS